MFSGEWLSVMSSPTVSEITNPHADGLKQRQERTWTGKSSCQPSQSEILLGSEEFQTEMISTVMAFQVVCYVTLGRGRPHGR